MTMSTQVQREGLSIAEACEMVGVGKTTLYQLIKEGRIKKRKIGMRSIILRSDVKQFLLELSRAA
jgi:excisionase family DNA binding protein